MYIIARMCRFRKCVQGFSGLHYGAFFAATTPELKLGLVCDGSLSRLGCPNRSTIERALRASAAALAARACRRDLLDVIAIFAPAPAIGRQCEYNDIVALFRKMLRLAFSDRTGMCDHCADNLIA